MQMATKTGGAAHGEVTSARVGHCGYLFPVQCISYSYTPILPQVCSVTSHWRQAGANACRWAVTSVPGCTTSKACDRSRHKDWIAAEAPAEGSGACIMDKLTVLPQNGRKRGSAVFIPCQKCNNGLMKLQDVYERNGKKVAVYVCLNHECSAISYHDYAK